ncbi:hypothetical protein QR680_014570 [Steinernema hermaphroditum]|uniref:G-protein coupled receptors family 2 profile 2 domain-containing protein n=1 Tax=Steinernema hermaphroditum TaxID=289476 RepID=A0AA39IAT5_9BILA|nr:hypothetical protein QR680_014570 [Steinernema hermaphroditum]
MDFSDVDLAQSPGFVNSVVTCVQAFVNCYHDNTTSCPINPGFCKPNFDSVHCWEETAPNTTILKPCIGTHEGIPYSGGYASRYCDLNGNWSTATYEHCRPAFLDENGSSPISDDHVKILYLICWIGYSVSTVVGIVALSIFMIYKSLWCLRNFVHSNLIFCFTIHNIIWMATSILFNEIQLSKSNHYLACIVPNLLFQFFTVAGLFWMFVEGLIIFFNVIYAFNSRQFTYKECILIGWVLPFAVISVHVIWDHEEILNYRCDGDQKRPVFDWCVLIPCILVLFANFAFLMAIISVVVTQLRVTVREDIRRYQKGIRAFVVLIPLLGMNYLILLFHPTNPRWFKTIFYYYSVIINSTQCMWVAFFFCFGNNEVQEILYRHMMTVKTSLKLRAEIARRRSFGTETRDTLLVINFFVNLFYVVYRLIGRHEPVAQDDDHNQSPRTMSMSFAGLIAPPRSRSDTLARPNNHSPRVTYFEDGISHDQYLAVATTRI